MTVAVNDGSGLQYLLTDHLGSVVAITNASGTLTSQQRYLPFGQVRTDVPPIPNSPITQTDFGYTGQRNLDSLGLMDYHARFYDATLMRWTQPDTITPGGPQGLNRFSYVNNDPINVTDPTGHDPNHDKCDYYGDCVLETYTPAAIKMESIGAQGRAFSFVRNFIGLGKGRYDAIGLAQISDAEMELPYGKDDGRKVGLGLRVGKSCTFGCEMDQTKDDVAILAMETKLTLRQNVCTKHNCTDTDMFMTSLLAADERINLTDLDLAFNKYKSGDPKTTKIDWSNFLNGNWKTQTDYTKNAQLINLFTANVKDLQNKGYYVPDIVWEYVAGLTK
jgi:RHS repeat-associated protein